MLKLSRLIPTVVSASLGLALPVHATQPPDVVQSDSASDTAMGASALAALTTGYQNTGGGTGALQQNTTGFKNAAFGFAALSRNVSGFDNAAFGSGALYQNPGGSYGAGSDNSAFGMDALYSNLYGGHSVAIGSHALYAFVGDVPYGGNGISANTAVGAYALYSATDGSQNTAVGNNAMYYNTQGSSNVAVGDSAFYSGNGQNNTAIGFSAMDLATSGDYNTAVGSLSMTHGGNGGYNVSVGANAMELNANGGYNTALGYAALLSATGSNSVAIGYNSLSSQTTGGNNIAIGTNAGARIVAGTNNIDIGASPSGDESDSIRIGTTKVHKYAYIMGINTQRVTGAAVYVTSTGQLGVLASSERYKTAVKPISAAAGKLDDLRPVSFHLKNDPNGPIQYGLIAEEVDRVYPELVIRDEAGVIQGVRYEELAPMLLSQIKQDHESAARIEKVVRTQANKIEHLEQQLGEMREALLQLQKGDQRLASR